MSCSCLKVGKVVSASFSEVLFQRINLFLTVTEMKAATNIYN